MNPDKASRGIWSWDIVKFVVLISCILFTGVFLLYGWNEDGLRHNIRWTARISFVLFCMAFSASSVHWYVRNSLSWWLRMNRKFIGVSFAIIHLIHLVTILLLQYFFHPVFESAAITSIVGGGGAYLLIILMLVTSFERFAKYLSNKHWKYLHTTGGYWIWIVFLSTYLKRVDEPIHWLYVLILFFVLGFRILFFFKNDSSN